MFGSSDKNQVDAQQTPAVAAPADTQSGNVGVVQPPDSNPPPHPSEVVTPTAPPLSNDLVPTTGDSPAIPLASDGPMPAVGETHPDNAYMEAKSGTTSSADGSGVQSTAPPAGGAADGLIDIKQQALQSLAPLVNKLEQTPEEKFKTTMMLIQASDNSQLINEAYAAANEIKDEKARAQALLDIVNEINYFTQHADGEAAQ